VLRRCYPSIRTGSTAGSIRIKLRIYHNTPASCSSIAASSPVASARLVSSSICQQRRRYHFSLVFIIGSSCVRPQHTRNMYAFKSRRNELDLCFCTCPNVERSNDNIIYEDFLYSRVRIIKKYAKLKTDKYNYFGICAY